MTMIYHMTARTAWEQAQQDGVYRAPSLNDEGFIHFSTRGQLVATANRFYAGRRDMVLLETDTEKLNAELRYEAAAHGELFPHLYGALNLDAVTRTFDFTPDADGVWRSLPSALI